MNVTKKCLHLFAFSLAAINVCTADITFKDAQEAADFAVNNSTTYRLEELSVNNTLQNARRNIADFLPTFDISYSEDDSIKYNGNDSRSKSLSLSLNQFVFDGGKKFLSYDMENTEAYYSYLSYLKEIRTFKSQIIEQYYECLMQQEIVNIKKELLDNAKTQLDILDTEYKVGRALETDLIDFLISYSQIENEYKQAQRELNTLKRKFNVALNLDPNFIINITPEEVLGQMPEELEDLTEILWNRLLTVNPDIEKNKVSIVYAEKQLEYSKLFFIPEVSLNASVSMSGDTYPLTEPSYSIRLNFSFSNSPLFPLTLSNGYGLSDKGLTSLKDSSSVSLSPQPTYSNSNTSTKLSLIQQINQNKEDTQTLYESFFEQLASYDDYLDSIEIAERTISLQERKLEIEEQQVTLGKVTRTDYLEDLTELYSKKADLLKSKISLISLAHSLEITLDIPFGGLYETCEEFRN